MLNRKFLSAACIALAIGLPAPSQSSAELTDLGGGEGNVYASGVSADGSVIVGYSETGDGDRAFKYTVGDGVMTSLGTLGAHSYAFRISGDGSVIVGTSETSLGDRAFKYTVGDGVMTSLGTLGGQSFGRGVSEDGSVIVGTSQTSLGDRAFKYTGGVMTSLGTLGEGQNSYASGVSGDGYVIVGHCATNSGDLAFKYMVDEGVMTSLSTLGGNSSRAHGVSEDGSVIVGTSHIANGDTRAFKYTGGVMTSLGTLGGQNSDAYGVSEDGSVIVGSSQITNGDTRAFKYTVGDGVMTSLGTLGGNNAISYAVGVSEDGSVIVGSSESEGVSRAFVYMDGAGMLDAVEWMQSISGPAGIMPIVTSLSSLTMEGAHHRPLMSLDMMGKKSQSWVTGDFGARSRTSDSNTTSGEAGVSGTFGDVIAGVAVGYGEQNSDLLFDGTSHISGQYILGEVDMRLSDNASILSLTTMIGNWKSKTLRGYGVEGGGVDYSLGSTNLNSASVRLRVDGPAHKLIDGPSITPFASFTWSRTTADAYDENGGSFDAHFNDQKNISREGRLGLSSKFALSPDTTLLATAEWIHRFDKTESGFSGTDIDHGALPFDVAGAAITANQARFGLDVDHKLAPDTMLNFSVHFAGVGPAADVSTALSIRRAF